MSSLVKESAPERLGTGSFVFCLRGSPEELFVELLNIILLIEIVTQSGRIVIRLVGGKNK